MSHYQVSEVVWLDALELPQPALPPVELNTKYSNRRHFKAFFCTKNILRSTLFKKNYAFYNILKNDTSAIFSIVSIVSNNWWQKFEVEVTFTQSKFLNNCSFVSFYLITVIFRMHPWWMTWQLVIYQVSPRCSLPAGRS